MVSEEEREKLRKHIESNLGTLGPTRIEDIWSLLMVRQGGRCRNCKAKATLHFIKFDSETGDKILAKTENSQKIDIYKLCTKCAIDIDNAKDIKTYEWTYPQIRARDERLDAGWHRKVYGSG